MKKKILIVDLIIKDFEYIYKKNFSVIFLWEITDDIIYSEIEAVVVTGGFKTNITFLKKFKKLKIISIFGIGYDGVDIKYCKKNNILVTNTPDVLTNDVADLALGLMISLSRSIHIGHNHIIKNIWSKSSLQLTDSLKNKKVGVVGMGNIGKSFAKKAKALSLEVFYSGPNKKNVKYKYFNDLQKMAKEINFLVITCKGGLDTYKIINNKIINSLQNNAFIINVSRGSVIDENALLKALERNKIKGAALDVFENEPKINPRFKKLKNILLSPHHGSGTKETRLGMAKISYKNILNFFKNKKPIYRVK